MLLYHLRELCTGMLLLLLVIMACAGYAYRANSRRTDDDPKKRDFYPVAIIFAPITFPLFAIFSISIFILRVLTYGIFLILLIVALLIFRNPFLLVWLRKTAMTIGDGLLGANTLLIKLFLKPWSDEPETI